MKVLPHLRKAEHRGAHPPCKHVECHQLADGESAIDDELCAEIERCRRHQLVDQLHGLARGVAQADDAKACRNVTRELLFPAPLHLRLDRHGFERLDAGDALDQEGLVLRAAGEFLIESFAKERSRARRDRDIEGKSAEDDPGQQRRVKEHHRQKDEGEEEIDHQCQCRAGEKITNVLEFAHARDRVADPSRLKIGNRQRHQMAEQSRAKLDIDAVGRMGEKIGAQDA